MQIALLFFTLVENKHHSIQKRTLQIDNMPRTLCTFPTISLLNIHPWVNIWGAPPGLILLWVPAGRRVRERSMSQSSPSFHLCSIRGHSPEMLGMKSFLRSHLVKKRAVNSFRSAFSLIFAFRARGSLLGSLWWPFTPQCTWCDSHTLCSFSHKDKSLLQNIFFNQKGKINTWRLFYLFVGISKEIQEVKDGDIYCAAINISSYWLQKGKNAHWKLSGNCKTLAPAALPLADLPTILHSYCQKSVHKVFCAVSFGHIVYFKVILHLFHKCIF